MQMTGHRLHVCLVCHRYCRGHIQLQTLNHDDTGASLIHGIEFKIEICAARSMTGMCSNSTAMEQNTFEDAVYSQSRHIDNIQGDLLPNKLRHSTTDDTIY